MTSTAGKTEGSLATRTTRLNEHVSLTRPLENADDKSSPSLVIIFGWFEAKFSHIAKYVDDYQRLYPAATVVVVESHFDWMYSTQHTRESCLEPVADILDELIESAGDAGFQGVILHVMSNGGAAQAMILSKVLAKRTRYTNARYPAAVVLDSTPDSHTLRCFLAGISASFSHPLAHLMAPPLVFLLYAVFRFSYGVTTPLLPEVRQRLNSPTFIPFYRNPARHKDGTLIDYPKIPASADISKEIQLIPRLYVCSKTDEITNFESVRNHIEEAKRSGLDVRAEIYDKSPHVSHARVDPERYWGAVQQLWKDARSRTPVPARL